MTESMEVSAIIASRVCSLMRETGLTEGILAERAGMGLDELLALEQGNPNATLVDLEKVAECFEIPVFELMRIP